MGHEGGACDPGERTEQRSWSERACRAGAPAGSFVFRPELLGDSLRPAEASLFALGVKPKRPAARKMVVDATMICNQHESYL
jgi:hypothetical protein